MKTFVHLRIKESRQGRPGTPHELFELAEKLGLPRPWHSERLSTMVLFFNPLSHVEAECDIAASIASGPPARRDGLTAMEHVDFLYTQLEDAHRQLDQLNGRLIAGENCWDELLDADARTLVVRRQLMDLVKSSQAAAIRFLVLRGRISKTK